MNGTLRLESNEGGGVVAIQADDKVESYESTIEIL